MTQVSFKTVAIDTLARRIVANRAELDGHPPWNRVFDTAGLDTANAELLLVATLMGIEAEVTKQIERIERERAKEVTP